MEQKRYTEEEIIGPRVRSRLRGGEGLAVAEAWRKLEATGFRDDRGYAPYMIENGQGLASSFVLESLKEDETLPRLSWAVCCPMWLYKGLNQLHSDGHDREETN